MVVGLFGILKAGGAYVLPWIRDYPPGRLGLHAGDPMCNPIVVADSAKMRRIRFRRTARVPCG